MRSLLSLASLIASLVALVVARDLEIRHKAIPSKRYAQARVVRGLDGLGNRSLTNEVGALGGRDLEKRFEGARFTFYDAGLGACGETNTNADYIVALNAIQYDGGGHCREMITIIANGKTGTAQIMDRCEGCPYGGLDFSRGLFDYFASQSAGVISGAWYFGGAPATPVTTTTTLAPAPTPTTTYFPSPTTTTTPVAYTPSPSSSMVLSGSSTSSFSSSTSSALDALMSSSPNATTSSSEGVLEQFGLVLVHLGAIVVVGGSKLD